MIGESENFPVDRERLASLHTGKNMCLELNLYQLIFILFTEIIFEAIDHQTSKNWDSKLEIFLKKLKNGDPWL